jgi:hypothetical protein
MQHSWKPPTPLHLRALLSCSRSCYNFSLAAGKITVYGVCCCCCISCCCCCGCCSVNCRYFNFCNDTPRLSCSCCATHRRQCPELLPVAASDSAMHQVPCAAATTPATHELGNSGSSSSSGGGGNDADSSSSKGATHSINHTGVTHLPQLSNELAGDVEEQQARCCDCLSGQQSKHVRQPPSLFSPPLSQPQRSPAA